MGTIEIKTDFLKDGTYEHYEPGKSNTTLGKIIMIDANEIQRKEDDRQLP